MTGEAPSGDCCIDLCITLHCHRAVSDLFIRLSDLHTLYSISEIVERIMIIYICRITLTQEGCATRWHIVNISYVFDHMYS